MVQRLYMGEKPGQRLQALAEFDGARDRRAARAADLKASWNKWRRNRYSNAAKLGQNVYGLGQRGLAGLGNAAGALGRGAAGAAGVLGTYGMAGLTRAQAAALAAAQGTRKLAGNAGNAARLALKRGLFGKRTLTEDQIRGLKEGESLNSPAFLNRLKRARTLELIGKKEALPLQPEGESAKINWPENMNDDERKKITEQVDDEFKRKGGLKALVKQFPGMLQFLGNKSLTVLYYAGLIPVGILASLGLGAEALVGAAGRGLGAIGTGLGSLAQGVKNRLATLKGPNLSGIYKGYRKVKHAAGRYLRGNINLEKVDASGKPIIPDDSYYTGFRAAARNLLRGKIGRTESARIRSAKTRATRDLFCKEHEDNCDEYGKVKNNSKSAFEDYNKKKQIALKLNTPSSTPTSSNTPSTTAKKSGGIMSGARRFFGKIGSYFTKKSTGNSVATNNSKGNSTIQPGLLARTRKALGNAVKAVGSGFSSAAGKAANALRAVRKGLSNIGPEYKRLREERKGLTVAATALKSAANSPNPAVQQKAVETATTAVTQAVQAPLQPTP